jgi:Uma2 family endonuclease
MSLTLHPPQTSVLLRGISWETYQQLLDDRGQTSCPRLAYDQGTLEIMTPNFAHEDLNRTLAQLIVAIAIARDIDYCDAGSTTFDRQDVDKGFEPDSCFYFAQAAVVQGKQRLDLDVDPPPELVIEIDITHPSLSKLPICAALGIAEVWRYNGTCVEIYRLCQQGYQRAEVSAVLEGVTTTAIAHFLDLRRTMSGPEWFRTVMAWAQSY